jgi:hypothetical protein
MASFAIVLIETTKEGSGQPTASTECPMDQVYADLEMIFQDNGTTTSQEKNSLGEGTSHAKEPVTLANLQQQLQNFKT